MLLCQLVWLIWPLGITSTDEHCMLLKAVPISDSYWRVRGGGAQKVLSPKSRPGAEEWWFGLRIHLHFQRETPPGGLKDGVPAGGDPDSQARINIVIEYGTEWLSRFYQTLSNAAKVTCSNVCISCRNVWTSYADFIPNLILIGDIHMHTS